MLIKNVLTGFEVLSWLRPSNYLGPIWSNKVAVTFDDGPCPGNTVKVLEILKARGVSATFFFIPEHAKRMERENAEELNLILKMIKEGRHEIALHEDDYIPTWRTRLLGKWGYEKMAEDMAYLRRLSGSPPVFYRPHYFHLGPAATYASLLGLKVVLGTPWCFAKPDAPVVYQVAKFTKGASGSILIFHDGITMARDETHIVEALPSVLEHYLSTRYRLGTVSELFR
jgi:peptidoglycan/xylan/chitin deacetylase (PgdA/CDA1 family)